MVILRETSDGKIKYRFLVFGIMLVILSAIISGAPVFAAQCGGADTALVECGNDEGGIWHILSLILDIMSIGVGILGVIGIMIAGIQYLTAGDKEEQTVKAKRRIYEIVIGLVLYAVLFVGLEWLLPGGVIRSESDLAKSGSTTQIEELEEQREAERDEIAEMNDEADDEEGGSSSSSNSKDKTNKGIRKKIAKVAKTFAKKKNRKQYKKAVKKMKIKGDRCFKNGQACSAYVATVIRMVVPKSKRWPAMSHLVLNNYLPKHKKTWKKVSAKNAKPGDVGVKRGHIAFVVKYKGELRIAEANYDDCKGDGKGGWPRISGSSPTSRTSLTYYRYIGGTK